MEISGGEKGHWAMKKEEKKGQRREKEYHSVEIGKSLMKATGIPLHPGVQMRSPSNQN